MIDLRPFDHHGAMAVIRNLDPFDTMEAEATRGAAASHLAIFAEWCAIEGVRVGSWIISKASTGEPFAVLALTNTGQGGVAGAALLSRDQRRYRRELVALARLIRVRMPTYCAELGIHRIEARAWAKHPRASKFLSLIGFTHETDMPGFGPNGHEIFRQFAWTPGLPQRERT